MKSNYVNITLYQPNMMSILCINQTTSNPCISWTLHLFSHNPEACFADEVAARSNGSTVWQMMTQSFHQTYLHFLLVQYHHFPSNLWH